MRLGLGIFISLVALVIVFYFADIDEVIAAIRRADFRYLLPALGIYILSLITRGLAWRVQLREQIDLMRSFFTVSVGYMLNNLLPFRLGEVGRALLISQTSPVAFWQAASTILIERIFDLMLSVCLLLATLPLAAAAALSQGAVSWALPAALSAGGMVLLALILLYLFARYRQQALELVERLAQRWPWLNRLGINRLGTFFNGLAALTELGRFLGTLGWMVVTWILWVVEFHLLLRAYIPEAPFLWAAFSVAAATMGVAIPASPGGLGVVEASVVGALAVFGVDASPALAFALTMHAVYFTFSTVLGMIGLWREGESLSRLYRRLLER